ncbi:hypothetical protein GCM10010377_70330 [Streptomyces viridiviolaceus]|uniref:Integral membrane protein n=1 Tax=Streptomyces viridiviolaceus TaxID=68282 RepID=A0ABW2E645_9ACTN|nr:hypothetical protein [Streptomyces viridiviolaceus]GHB69566.1 hypothetical protein GCM10010377_70330 [Streptomyces viridiviolaceus]
MTNPPRNPYDRRPTPAPASARRPGVATAAGVFAMLLGLTMACYAAYTGIKTFESGFGPIIGLVLLLFGLSIARNAFLLLKADWAGAERLTMQLGIIAGLSGVAIGAMVAQADFDNESAKTQLIGFITALILSVTAIALCSLRGTKNYVEGRRPSTPRLPPRIG